MPTEAITKRLIDKIQAIDVDLIIFDTKIRGFGLKVAPSGRKTFIPKYTNPHGRQRKPTIGTYGDITLDQARKIASKWKARIVQGGDPSADKRNTRNSHSFNDFAEVYFRDAQKKESTLLMERCYYRNHVENHLGKKPLTQLEHRDIQAWYAKLADRPGAAGRTLSLLTAMFNEAERQQLRPLNSNPTRLIKRYPSRTITRFLSLSELSRLGETLREIDNERSMHPSVIPAIRFALLTGARKSEVLELKWDWVDFDRSIALLPDSKTGERPLYLSTSAVDVLQSILRIEGNPFVFPGRNPGDHLHNLRKPFKEILRRASIEDFRIHDLRHTHASYGVKAGLSLHLISKTLGHTQARTSERYAHLDDCPGLLAVERISEEMAAVVNGKNRSLH